MKNVNDPKVKPGIVILGTAVFVLTLLNIYLLLQSDFFSVKKKELIQQNQNLEKTIEEAKLELSKFKGINNNLDNLIKEANIKISEQHEKIRNVDRLNKSLKEENDKLALEINALKDEYLETIDSLLLADGMNMVLENTIEYLEEEILQLKAEIGYASLLVADNLEVSTLKSRPSGDYKGTVLAKNVSNIKVCFDLIENKTAQKGFHEIYLRILSPDARVLFHEDDKDLKIMHPILNVPVNYSHSEPIKYNNEKSLYCINWSVTEKMKPGIYIIEVFTHNNMLSTSAITIK